MPQFHVLNQLTARQAKISDHDPIIFNEFFVWNIMMQGRYNEEKQRYNNGFGIKNESQADYQQRLKMVVKVIAEACNLNRDINIIALQEAPIKPEDIGVFAKEFKRYKSLEQFSFLIKSSNFSKMGVVTIINSNKYQIKQKKVDYTCAALSTLQDRSQQFMLIDRRTGEKHYINNMHLPFDLAKKVENRGVLLALMYMFLHQESAAVESHSLLGDFNFNPALLFQAFKYLSGYVPQDNNILLKCKAGQKSIKSDTVDAVISTYHLLMVFFILNYHRQVVF
jgi:hypothetical protein